MKNPLKFILVLAVVIFIIYILFSSNNGKDPKIFAKEMCDKMRKEGMMSVSNAVSNEKEKHNQEWFNEYLTELKRLGCY